MHNVLNKLHVPFLDLKISDSTERQRYLKRIETVFEHGHIVNGPEVEIFEQEVAAYCGSKYAVGVGSGTDALILALKAFEIGVGDEVITSCLSFVGTANAITAVGAIPVFVDVKKNLLIDHEKIEAAVTARTKAIMPVHFTGKLCQISELLSVANRLKIPVIEDAAPAFGASFNGQKAGSFGVMGCISMNPMKILNAFGEAGIILTNNAELKEKLYSHRYHGLLKDKETCAMAGNNARFDTIQAAILLERLNNVDFIIKKRREIAKHYTENLSHLMYTPKEIEGYRDIFYTYTVQTEHRNNLANFLLERGIQTKFYHRILIPDQPAYAISNQHRKFPVGKTAVNQILCLPLHEKLTDSQVEHVIGSIQSFFENEV